MEFIAAGFPRVVSQAIEQCARGQGNVTAIVVPWESDAARLSMAVTLARGDGWAVEHTNLGTIQLTDAGRAQSRVTIVAELRNQPQPDALVALLGQ